MASSQGRIQCGQIKLMEHWAWGLNTAGQLGKKMKHHRSPTQILGLIEIVFGVLIMVGFT